MGGHGCRSGRPLDSDFSAHEVHKQWPQVCAYELNGSVIELRFEVPVGNSKLVVPRFLQFYLSF